MDEQYQDLDKNNILYKPILAPEKEYKSDETFSHSKTTTPSILEVPDNEIPPQETIDNLKQISEIMGVLPEGLEPVRNIVNKLIKRLEIVFPDGKMPESFDQDIIETTTRTYITTTNVPDSISEKKKGVPSLFPAESKINISYESPKSIVQLVTDAYYKDNIRLAEYYTQQLQLVMQKYFEKMLLCISEIGLDDVNALTQDFDGNAVTIPLNRNIDHCKDLIIRSQAGRKQMSRLLKKTHSDSEMLQHVRAWHTAYKQRDRYYSESYGNSLTFTESHSNALLRESRTLYNERYDQCLGNMYRYLNSSIKFTDDILTATVKEAEAKIKLLKEGVDIYKTTDYGDFQAGEKLLQGQKHDVAASGRVVSTATGATSEGGEASGGGSSLGYSINTTHPGVQKGFDAMKGKSYTANPRNGCVWAATNIGKYYSNFLKNEAGKGVVGVDQLVADAKNSNMQVIPFDESKLEAGDTIVYEGNKHVVIATGGKGYCGNSSSQAKVTGGSNYNFMKPTSIIKTSKG